jgi:outer membrane protein OmpA-like peptidoglycan-associated protein
MKLRITIASLVFVIQALAGQPLNNPAFDQANSEYDELNPVLSPDGQTLYVTIANHPQNLGGKKDPGDIWYSVREENNTWSQPVHGGAQINDRGFNSIAGFSFDGTEMFLLNHFDPQGGTPRTQGISVSRRSGSSWSFPKNISIPYFQNKGSALYGYVSPDKNYFVFSAETYGTKGVEDIYIAERDPSGKWMAPKNLGSTINTQFQELCPSLSDDGKTLYFSSNGRKGSGSFDVYSATRLDDSWQNWSEPVNVGTAVNTEGRDLFYRPFARLGFSLYTSTKNSDGYGDIRVQQLDTPPQDPVAIASTEPVETVVEPQIEEVRADPARTHSVKVHGKVFNAKTGEAIPATITFQSKELTTEGVEKIAATAQGYAAGVGTGGSFRVTIESNGYISTVENLDIKTYEMNDLEMNFNLQPVDVGTTVNLKGVLFEQSKTTLLPQSFDELDVVVSFMKSNPRVKIELAGHTDNQGMFSKNIKLSQERVDTVKEYLVSKGIDDKRITGKGYGGTKPIASNDKEETRKLNRRVEFTIIKN